MKSMRTGILDDHPLFVEGLSAILSNYPWIDLVFRGENGASLRQFLQEQKLDLLFLDINLGKDNGIDLIEECKRHDHSMRIIILTTHQPADNGLDMSRFLGDAYMLKISGRKVLEEAIKKVCNGETYTDPNLTIAPKKPAENPFRLTKREYEIIELIRQGCTTREIAERLFLSELTIKTHRRNISEKLDSRNVAEMLSRITKK